MATHSSVLAWRIPGTGEPGGLPSMGSHRVGHYWSDLAAAAAAAGIGTDRAEVQWPSNESKGSWEVLLLYPGLGWCPNSWEAVREDAPVLLSTPPKGGAGQEAEEGFLTAKVCQLKKKKCTSWELQVKFYLRQNEDCSPGGSISDSSERLLQSSSGGKSIYKVLVKGEFNTMKHSFYKSSFVIHEDLMSPGRDLVLL